MWAIVTGGAVRVGKAISLHLAESGYNIVLVYNSSAKEAEKVADKIAEMGRETLLVGCNLADAAAIDDLFSDLKVHKIKPTILVNNAAVFDKLPFADDTEENFDRHLAVNLKAPYFLAQGFSRVAGENANIINISDSYTKRNTGKYFAYLLSKKGLNNLNEMLSVEVAPIRVNAIALGIMDMPQPTSSEYVEKRVAATPLKQKVSIKDVTKTIDYILKTKSVTGQVINIDSGESLVA
jgi:pteridine reductase